MVSGHPESLSIAIPKVQLRLSPMMGILPSFLAPSFHQKTGKNPKKKGKKIPQKNSPPLKNMYKSTHEITGHIAASLRLTPRSFSCKSIGYHPHTCLSTSGTLK
jgi:hypothetical protein